MKIPLIILTCICIIFGINRREDVFGQEAQAQNQAGRFHGSVKICDWHPVRLIEYIAGADGEWFSDDDAPLIYDIYEYDPAGRLIAKKGYLPGPDKLIGTSDDALYSAVTGEYDKQGRLAGGNSTVLGGEFLQGIPSERESFSYNYTFDPQGHRKRYIKYEQGKVIAHTFFEYKDGRLTRCLDYSRPGADGRWFTRDDILEKYHLFAYDQGCLSQVREINGRQGGRGKDKKWLGKDDTTTSTRRHFYDASGKLLKENKYISPGPDGEWFSGDDRLQYYVVYEYQAEEKE